MVAIITTGAAAEIMKMIITDITSKEEIGGITSDEVASWFGDDDAERRRNMDKMYGPHKGKGPKGYRRSDEKIRDEINDKLYHDSFIDASNIDVKVEDGDVVLSDTVESRGTKRRTEDLVDEVTGVKDINNNLKINKTEPPTVRMINMASSLIKMAGKHHGSNNNNFYKKAGARQPCLFNVS